MAIFEIDKSWHAATRSSPADGYLQISIAKTSFSEAALGTSSPTVTVVEGMRVVTEVATSAGSTSIPSSSPLSMGSVPDAARASRCASFFCRLASTLSRFRRRSDTWSMRVMLRNTIEPDRPTGSCIMGTACCVARFAELVINTSVPACRVSEKSGSTASCAFACAAFAFVHSASLRPSVSRGGSRVRTSKRRASPSLTTEITPFGSSVCVLS
mmetsp:Transcript_5665/g.11861  ORF Transcript_5665/g.11861 Transcript_5665/m.11861 type:complete len:213 (-) Transcript_5665:1429-2067(-)